MAGICPCGCGRRLGFNKSGAAKAYNGCTTIIDNATPLVAEIKHHVSERDGAELAQVLVDANAVRAAFLEHLHGEARPGRTPDLLALAQTYKSLAGWYEALGTWCGAF